MFVNIQTLSDQTGFPIKDYHSLDNLGSRILGNS